MSLRYCQKCKETYDDIHSLCVSERYYCLHCNQPLIYFGKEEFVLSIQEVIDSYDLLHPHNPLQDYKGVYKTYDAVSVNQSLLECEDVLAYDPTNKEALIYLSKHAWSKQLADKALEYIQLAYNSHELELHVYYYFVTVLLMNNAYEDVLVSLEHYKARLDEFYIDHYKAIAYLGLKRMNKSLFYFYKSYTFCSEENRKRKIKTVIRRLTTLVEG